jgi:Double-GTPase 2
MSQVVGHRCKLPQCTVATTGKCFEGLELSDCPNYLGTETEAGVALTAVASESEEAADDAEQQDEAEMIDLPDGLDFTPATASLITRAKLTRVIVIAGDQDSGKTTLVSSLFDKFQEGPFAGYLFAGCRTLPGLERRCFPSRIASERMHPNTTRTPRGDGQSLLHLKVRIEDLSHPTQGLLLSDISGEFFRDACDSTEGCQQLKVLRRADHLVLCLDGEKLASIGLRHEAYNTGKLLLQSTLDAEMIGRRTFVDILFTKRDLLGPLEGSSALNYLNNVRQGLMAEFADRLGRLRFFEVAARPSVAGFPLAYGLDRVLPSWVEDTPLYTQPQLSDLRVVAASLAQTEFDRYILRRPSNNRS